MPDNTEAPITTKNLTTTDIIDDTTAPPPPYEMPNSYATVVILIIALVMLFSLIGNTLALISLCKNRKTVYPWFFNLALSDLLKTLLCMPYSIYLTQTQYYSEKEGFESDTKCLVIGYIFNLTMLMGLISNMCVALDRVHATYFPFHYSNNMKRCPPLYLILLTWIFVPLIAALPFFIQTIEQAKTPFTVLEKYMPMCLFDISDASFFNKENVSRETMDAVIAIYYFLLYMSPLVVIITCTILVMKKLLPRILAERKLHDGTKSSVVIANSTAMGDDPGTGLSTFGEENQLDAFYPNGASTPKSGKKGMLSMVDNMLKLHTGTMPTNRKNAKRNQHLWGVKWV